MDERNALVTSAMHILINIISSTVAAPIKVHVFLTHKHALSLFANVYMIHIF